MEPPPSKPGSEPEPLTEVRRTDPRSAEIKRPDGVARSFQVSVNKVEPREAKFRTNLLPQDDWRPDCSNELEPDGPEVPLVSEASLGAGIGQGLTRTRACPDGTIGRPSCEIEGEVPSSDPSEEVRSSNSSNVVWCDFRDRSVIHASFGDPSSVHEVAKPLCGERFVLVVVGGHRKIR